MMHTLDIKARDLCLMIAALLAIELCLALIISRDFIAGFAAAVLAGLAFASSKRLSEPLKVLDTKLALASSLPAFAVLLAGAVMLMCAAYSWLTWLCIVSGYIIGNRVKAAGIDVMSLK